MKTTKVYHAPGYPIDPKKEEKRMYDGIYECVIVPQKPIRLKSQTVELTFGTVKEAAAFLQARGRYFSDKRTSD